MSDISGNIGTYDCPRTLYKPFILERRLLYQAFHMPRSKVIIDPQSFYHVTARSLNREWFRLQLPQVWHIFSSYLAFISRHYNVSIYDFVLMNNHYHLLVQFPECNNAESMQYFMRESSRAISRESGRINQSFGCRHHKCRITSHHHLLNVYKYIYQNPVRAGIVDRVEAYPFSTIRAKLGLESTLIPLREDLLMLDPQNRLKNLKWLNTATDLKNVDIMRRALRRSEFQLPIDRSTKALPKIASELI